MLIEQIDRTPYKIGKSKGGRTEVRLDNEPLINAPAQMVNSIIDLMNGAYVNGLMTAESILNNTSNNAPKKITPKIKDYVIDDSLTFTSSSINKKGNINQMFIGIVLGIVFGLLFAGMLFLTK
jgi:hypothetical protein